MDRSPRQKINMETVVLNDIQDQLDLINIYRTFHSKTAEDKFFSSVHGMFFRIDHILVHKTSLDKFKKREIISSIFPNHNDMKLKSITERKLGKKQTRGDYWTSLVVQWLRIRLPVQGTQVRALVWEDPTWRGATKPVCHNY